MSQEIVCQTCGDIGFPEALNYCIVCRETAEHTYCLEKLPKVLNEDIDWACEICLSKTLGDSSLDSSVVTVDGGQCDGASEGKTPCLIKQTKKQSTPDSDQKNAAANTETATKPSQTRPKRVRKTVTTSAESTTHSAQKNAAAATETATNPSQTRPKRVRKTATANTESTTDSAQTRSKRVRKTETTNTELSTCSTQTRSKTVRKTETTNTELSTCSTQTRSKTGRKTAAANTRSKVSNQNWTCPIVRKRRGRK